MNVDSEHKLTNQPAEIGADRLPWKHFAHSFRQQEWRSPIFCDMVMHDVRRFDRPVTMLDIGCGSGFDGVGELQTKLASHACTYIGVEPDGEITLPACCTESHRTILEEAPIQPGSVDIAFAVFVLEHVPNPQAFWDKVSDVLVDGGVFWGFTVDARNYYAAASQLMERLRVKDWYLDRTIGQVGQRYENYPTHYRANSPRQIRNFTQSFSSREFLSLHRVGQLDRVIPAPLRFVAHGIDRFHLLTKLPGANLVVRLVK